MIVWLASYPRSGNTFFRVILNSVFNIKTNSLSNDLNDIGADKATSNVVGHEFLPDDFNIEHARQESKVYYIKTHEQPKELVSPEDKIIYLLRDGRESTLSFMKYDNTFGAKKEKKLMDIITGNIYFGSWGDHVKNWDPKNRKNTLLIKFEDLVENPSSMIEKISNFIDIKPVGNSIPTFEELKKINPQFFRSGKKDSWKKAYTESEHHEFWNKNFQIMQDYEYMNNAPKQIEQYKLKISVITPTYNSVKYLERAIQSVLSQNYFNFEHIIIDGKSTDGTLGILKKYPHIKWISEKDEGQADAMNKGFGMVSGDIIVYLNSDDYFLPEAFRKVIQKFEEGAVFVVGNVHRVYGNGRVQVQDPQVKLDGMLRHWEPNAFPHNPVQYFYKKEVQEACPFNANNHWAMDHEFLLEAASRFPFTKINEILGVYSIVAGAKTVEGQKDPFNYWQHKNFAYVDRFLANKSTEFVIEFKNDQYRFFIERIRDYTNGLKKNIIASEKKFKNQEIETKEELEELYTQKKHNMKLREALTKVANYSVWKHPVQKFHAYRDMLKIHYVVK